MKKKGKSYLLSRKITIRTFENAIDGLNDFCKYIKTKIGTKIKILEIGCFAGDSSEIFALNFKSVYCVDVWASGYDILDFCSDDKKFNMIEVENQFDEVANYYKNIQKIKLKSDEAYKLFEDNFFDVIYFDSIHQYEPVKNDIINWNPKIKNMGFISGHDYNNIHFPGVKKAVDEMIIFPDEVFLDSSWIKRNENLLFK